MTTNPRTSPRCGLLIALVCAASLAVAGSTGSAGEKAATPSTAYATVTTVDLAAMLQSKDFFFVNVHIPYEGEIAETDANIPYDRIADHLAALPADRNARIVLYCMSGRMSEIAAETLSGLGYTGVTHVAGGMRAWEKDGNEIIEK
jgi:rhodanese-related sulfurtransferase